MLWDAFRSSINSLPLPGISSASYPSAGSSLPPASAALPLNATFTRQTTTAWQHACQAYLDQHPTAGSAQSANFLYSGEHYFALAELILERRQDIHAQGEQRIYHIENRAGLLAVFAPAQRLVQMRIIGSESTQGASAEALNLREMPATAQILEGKAAQSFHQLSVTALFWYFGQAATQALQQMPPLDQQLLHIQRFPHLPPNALMLRHLQLIHLLGQRPVSFEELLVLLPKAARPFYLP